MKVLIIDLYSGQTEILPPEQFEEATQGLDSFMTEVATTYKGEDYMVVVLK